MFFNSIEEKNHLTRHNVTKRLRMANQEVTTAPTSSKMSSLTNIITTRTYIVKKIITLMYCTVSSFAKTGALKLIYNCAKN